MKATHVLLLLSCSTKLFAQFVQDPYSQISRPLKLKGPQALRLNPFSLNPSQYPLSFQRFQMGLITLDEAVRQFSLERFQDTLVKPVLTQANERSHTYQLHYAGVPLCEDSGNIQFRVHALSNQSVSVFGRFASIPSLPLGTEVSWISFNEAKEAAREYFLGLSLLGEEEDLQVDEKARCLFVDDTLAPVWSLIVTMKELSYSAFVGEEGVVAMHPRFFSAEAQVRAYDTNARTGELTDFVSEVEEDAAGRCKLENKFFVAESTVASQVAEEDCDFVYSTRSPQFSMASAFVHANLQHDWFADLGYRWHGGLKIRLLTRVQDENAEYNPAVGNALPKILIGQGMGFGLQGDFALDTDVLAHEFGHHVVFQYLGTGTEERLVIHEGLADYFALSRTGDSCLAESLCAAEGKKCQIQGECLRTAENDITLYSPPLLEVHQRSQFLSGMLWDLREDEVPARDLEKIVFQGISLLNTTSGYRDLITAFMIADHEIFSGQYCDAIVEGAEARGLEDYLSNLSCDNVIGFRVTPSEKTQTKTKKSGFGCGTLGLAGSGFDPLILGTLLPLLVVLRRRRSS